MPSQPKMVKRVCVECDVAFDATLSEVKKGNKKHCSKECRLKQFRVDIQCSYCNNIYTTTKGKLKKSKANNHFCSNECKYKAASDSKHRYNTGPNPAALTENTYRQRLLKEVKDPERVRCGYSEHVKLLDVDHIDSNRQNNELSNLQFLCVMCHAIKTRIPENF